MKLIESLRIKLAAIGATLDAGDYSLHCDAPSGYVWRANGLPSYHIHYATNSQSWLAKALREEKDSLDMGLELVTDPKDIEEHRWNLGDDNWGAPAGSPKTISFKA